MEQLLDSLAGLDPAIRGNLVNTAVIVVALLAIRWGILRVVRLGVQEPGSRYRWRKAVTYVTALLLLLLVGRIWSSGLSQLGTFLGLLTAALAISLREPVTNLAGWVFIVWRRPFKLGDRVQVGSHAGDVVDIRLFQFSLMEIGNWVRADQPTGRIVHLPNAKVFTEAQANYSSAFPYIFNEIPVLITFESNWRVAKELLRAIAVEHGLPGTTVRQGIESTSLYAISRLAGDPVVVTSVEDSGVLLTIRYLCEPTRRRGTTERMWEEILTAFGARDDIDFAYPTTRLYSNPAEGKRDTRPSLT